MNGAKMDIKWNKKIKAINRPSGQIIVISDRTPISNSVKDHMYVPENNIILQASLCLFVIKFFFYLTLAHIVCLMIANLCLNVLVYSSRMFLYMYFNTYMQMQSHVLDNIPEIFFFYLKMTFVFVA